MIISTHRLIIELREDGKWAIVYFALINKKFRSDAQSKDWAFLIVFSLKLD
jgi:hypothetical protein